MIDTAALTAAVATLQEYCEQVRFVMVARGYDDARVFVQVDIGGRTESAIAVYDRRHDAGLREYQYFKPGQFADALAYAESRPRQPTPADFAATIGIAPDGSLLDLCDDCGERPATETWDYSDAPIPNPPPPDRFCEQCADRRRDHALERAMEG